MSSYCFSAFSTSCGTSHNVETAVSASRLLDLTVANSHSELGDVETTAAVQLLSNMPRLSSVSMTDIEPLPLKLLRDLKSSPEWRLVLEPEVVPMRFVHSASDTVTTMEQAQEMAAFHGYSDSEITVLAGARTRAPMLENGDARRGNEQAVRDALQEIVLEFTDEC